MVRRLAILREAGIETPGGGGNDGETIGNENDTCGSQEMLGSIEKKSCSIDSGHDMSCRMYRRMDS